MKKNLTIRCERATIEYFSGHLEVELEDAEFDEIVTESTTETLEQIDLEVIAEFMREKGYKCEEEE